jgi:hypothetical protein
MGSDLSSSEDWHATIDAMAIEEVSPDLSLELKRAACFQAVDAVCNRLGAPTYDCYQSFDGRGNVITARARLSRFVEVDEDLYAAAPGSWVMARVGFLANGKVRPLTLGRRIGAWAARNFRGLPDPRINGALVELDLLEHESALCADDGTGVPFYRVGRGSPPKNLLAASGAVPEGEMSIVMRQLGMIMNSIPDFKVPVPDPDSFMHEAGLRAIESRQRPNL